MPNHLSSVLAMLQSQRNQLAAQLEQLDSALAALTGGRKRSRVGVARKKRVLSAAGRARIVAAQKKRWAEYKKAKGK